MKYPLQCEKGGIVLVSGSTARIDNVLAEYEQCGINFVKKDIITLSDGLSNGRTSSSVMYNMTKTLPTTSGESTHYLLQSYDISVDVLGTIKTHIVINNFVSTIGARDIALLPTCNNVTNRGLYHIQSKIVQTISLGDEDHDAHQLRRLATRWCSTLSSRNMEFISHLTMHMNTDDESAAGQFTSCMREEFCELLYQKNLVDPTKPPEL